MNRRALIVGLPASGKSTFIAAFWHVLTSEDVHGSLKLEVLDAPFEYLNNLSSRWRKFEELPRTSSDAENTSTIKVKRSGDGNQNAFDIVLPDLAGESIQRALVDRQWPANLNSFVERASGVLLFVHAGNVKEGLSIADADFVLSAFGENDPEPEDEGGSDELNWDASEVPTQVALVDLLQLVIPYFAPNSLRLAIIVSAWDLAKDENSPANWLKDNLPLLDQFLASSPANVFHRVYGVSAQGGDLNDKAECAQLKNHIQTSDRIQVALDCQSTSHDITEPIQWALGEVDE